METSNSNDKLLEQALVVGITGGIGSGKTEVANILAELNFTVISTDSLAKEVMSSNDKVKDQLSKLFGSETYNSNNSLNSAYLAKVVFTGDKNQKSNIEKLNSIVHPPVIDRMIKEIENKIYLGNKIVFVESALIFEAALADGFDYVICVIADDEKRIARVVNRSGLTREQIISRMDEQISQEIKISLSDFTIENNKSISELKMAVNFIIPIIQSLPPKQNFSD